MTAGAILGDAWAVYRLLFRRSVATAAVVYAVLTLVEYAADLPSDQAARVALGFLAFGFQLAGPVLVQGALVEIVRNVHQGRRPERIGALFDRSGDRFWSLLWASIVYGFGVVIGLFLLIVPGLIVAAKWCLMAPLIVLEGASAGDARRRSSGVVADKTWIVLGALILSFVLTNVPFFVFAFTVGGWEYRLAWFGWSSLTAPFGAHVLTVIYYRLVDPERPVIHADVKGWRSVWAGA